ncbi:amidohydrolase family protein [Streptomyces sp. KR80]|uniref:amidohydrolase family protein n=1 Tax=Streptomyces sp. KR80 TaxID=3457426 RepID=UPI003FD1BE78
MAAIGAVGPALPPLVDHHCHGVARSELDRAGFEAYLTESDEPLVRGSTFFDSQLGFAVRRWCAPPLGLEPHCPPERYLARRRELGAAEVTERLLRASGIDCYLVDTGPRGDLTTPQELATAGGGTSREIVRLERLAEDVADRCDGTNGFLDGLAEAIRTASRTAAGFKSVAGYRYGLDFEPDAPRPAQVRDAAERWLAGRTAGGRVTDPVLLRHLLWSAVGTGLPLQFHTGFGDPDLTLHRCDPLLLTGFVRAVRPTGCPLILLHGYPYHRNAAYLAHVFPHVHADVGLALNHAGARADAVLGEALELAPFGKLMFSSDGYGLPELHLVGARLFGEALTWLLTRWVRDSNWSSADAERVASLVAADNARRVYRLGAS